MHLGKDECTISLDVGLSHLARLNVNHNQNLTALSSRVARGACIFNGIASQTRIHNLLLAADVSQPLKKIKSLENLQLGPGMSSALSAIHDLDIFKKLHMWVLCFSCYSAKSDR